jgi:hypothetical protein
LGRRFGVLLEDDFRGAVDQLKARHAALRRDVLTHAPSGDAMCASYRRLVQQLVCSE